ncbi:MAG: signal peptidase II [Planctomycetes bacterium]|nr:signal peptidase II [Planctomycetota bacterium]
MGNTTERPYFCLFATLAIVGLIADQASKYVVFAQVHPVDARASRGVYPVIPGLFDLETRYEFDEDPGDQPLSFLRTISSRRLPQVNRGALFGIGNDGGGLNAFFLCVSFLAGGFIIYWASRPSVAQDRFLCLALGLILGGTLGNLYDRFVFGGVRDFLHWYVIYNGQVHVWPDFNVADCCLVCGAGVLLAQSLFVTEAASEPTDVGAIVVATTKSGATVRGAKVSQDDDGLVLKDDTGKEVRIPAGELSHVAPETMAAPAVEPARATASSASSV